MKTFLLALLLMIPSGIRALAADADTAAVMRQKLAASQRILAGLAIADFGLIQTNANSLVALSGQRGWTAMQTPDYELFSTQFRVSAEALAKAAKVRDIITNPTIVSAYKLPDWARDGINFASTIVQLAWAVAKITKRI